jgi:hypothetical protein
MNGKRTFGMVGIEGMQGRGTSAVLPQLRHLSIHEYNPREESR